MMDVQPTSDPAPAELTGESPPEHDALGRMLVLGIHGLGGAGFFALVLMGGSWGERLMLAGFGLMAVGMASFIAEAVRQFECWAWFVVMPWLAIFALVLAFEVGPTDVPAMIGLGIPVGLGIRYLWARRRDFWTDPPHYTHRHPPPSRWVTPEWRAARLARMAAEASAARAAVPPPVPRLRRVPTLRD